MGLVNIPDIFILSLLSNYMKVRLSISCLLDFVKINSLDHDRLFVKNLCLSELNKDIRLTSYLLLSDIE